MYAFLLDLQYVRCTKIINRIAQNSLRLKGGVNVINNFVIAYIVCYLGQLYLNWYKNFP